MHLLREKPRLGHGQQWIQAHGNKNQEAPAPSAQKKVRTEEFVVLNILPPVPG